MEKLSVFVRVAFWISLFFLMSSMWICHREAETIAEATEWVERAQSSMVSAHLVNQERLAQAIRDVQTLMDWRDQAQAWLTDEMPFGEGERRDGQILRIVGGRPRWVDLDPPKERAVYHDAPVVHLCVGPEPSCVHGYGEWQ